MLGSSIIFLQRLGLSTSNLASSWCLPWPNIKSHAEERVWAWTWARETRKHLEFPFNNYTMAESSDFKFGTQFAFAKAHHKTTPRGKVGVALG